MKSVLLSIQPKWCELIASGKKTVEVRKDKPTLETPFKCYIYETKGICEVPQFIDEDGHASYRGRGQVIGEFVCDCIEKEHVEFTACANIGRLYWCCMSLSELTAYIGKGDYAFYWHITELKIYDEPKELWEFRTPCKWRVNHGCFGYECEAPSHKVYCQYAVADRKPRLVCKYLYVRL